MAIIDCTIHPKTTLIRWYTRGTGQEVPMRAFAVSAMMIVAWLLPMAPASAWDDQGHELIGAIADAMLGTSKPGPPAPQIPCSRLRSAPKLPASHRPCP